MSGDTFGAEELELRRAAERSALLAGQSAEESLAKTCADLRSLVDSWAERQQRAFDALDSAGIYCLRGGSEEVGDGICRLAGERDQYKSLLQSIACGIGMQPDEHSGYLRVVQCALHLAAKAGEQVRTLAEQDARQRALENLLAEKNARIAALEREQGANRRAIDGALERLRAA